MGLISTKESKPIACCHIIIIFFPQTLVLERENCHVSSCHCTVKESNLVKHSKAGQTINSGQRLVKNGQIRGVKLEILIFLDVSTNLDYQISKCLIEKINANIIW